MSRHDASYPADSPQAAVQIGIEADICCPGKLRLFPGVADSPVVPVRDISATWNFDDGPDPAECVDCGSYEAAFEDGQRCPKCQAAFDATTPQM